MSLPSFIIAGAAKAGSSSLYSYLEKHPSIFMSIPKELNFFNSNKYELGMNWYEEVFSEATQGQICGEASVSYLPYSGVVAPRLSKHLPKIKLIFLLRDPVERFYSDYWFNVYRGTIKNKRGQFDKLVNGKIDLPDPGREEYSFRERLLNKGDYIKHLKKYDEYFKPEQIKVVLFEDFVSNPNGIVEEILHFLNLDEGDLLNDNPKIYNETKYPGEREYLFSILRSVKSILPNFLLDKMVKSRQLFKSSFYSSGKPEFLKESQSILFKYYEESITELSLYLNKDLSKWQRNKSEK